MACLATKEQAKLEIKMLNKTKQYVANEYKYRKQTNNLKIIQKRKRKNARNLWKKNNSRKQRSAMHKDQQNIQ